MPPRTKLLRHTAPGTNAPADKVEISGWERSKIPNRDQKTLKKLGLLKKQDSLIFPGEESFPRPPIGYRVTFIDHLIHGLSTPIHEFLRGLLFVYGIQLYQLTPNSILHISIFITLCECFLGTHPHWACGSAFSISDATTPATPSTMWVEFASASNLTLTILTSNSPTSSKGGAEGGYTSKTSTKTPKKSPNYFFSSLLPEGGEVDERAVVADDSQESSRPRSEVVGSQKSAASSEKETDSDPSESGRSVSPPLAVSPRNKRKRDEVKDSGTSKPSGSAAEETSPEEEGTFNPYDDAGSVSFSEEEGEKEEPTVHGALRQAEEHADALAAKLEFSEKSREKAEADAAVEDLRQRLNNTENALSDKIAQQIELVRMGEEFTLQEAEEDRLLDTLSILELQGDLACTNISNARAAFTRLFPHFFPKQTQPENFSELV
ncbi:hypothetical protein QYE76_067304 [Lolium multiflorum]|uniref:Transposase (putative) gypsy type domain-containing protein n=1 Tax=Lolium multiflorum TaxID=4521 RepID=A0AAD8SCK6_LOLMU|nr:hypothetical protein QYE76_067304 [Lolium multiflorum]